MLSRSICCALLWAGGLWQVNAGVAPTDLTLMTRNAPNTTSAETLRALGRALTRASLQKRDQLFKNSTTVEKSWNDAILFSYEKDGSASTAHSNTSASAGIEITCTTCYLQTKATASLDLEGSFNFTNAFSNITNQIATEFENITDYAVSYVEDYVKGVVTNLKDGLDASDFALPPFDVDFNIVMPEVPQANFTFRFDEMEIYVEIDTVLSGAMTYTLSLYKSETPLGIAISNDLEAGVIVSVDLILSSEAEIDVSSGFHIQLDDGVKFELPLFGQNVSDTDFNGGKFEFLPVTVTGQGSLSAVLRVGISAGFQLKESGGDFSVSAGVMMQVYAHVAEFTTNVTAANNASSNDGCYLQLEESYQLVLGAAAGASIAVDEHTWGPNPTSTVPVWFTTLPSACITAHTSTATATTPTTTGSASTKSSSSSSSSSTLKARADDEATTTTTTTGSSGSSLTTTTLKTTDTYTGVQCLSTGLANCPASLQTTAITKTTRTLVTAVASGATATWPSSVHATVTATRAFGTAAKDLFATSGTPTSFSPSATATTAGGLLGAVEGADKRVVIGVSVGVGSAVLIAIVAGAWYCHRRRKYQSLASAPPPLGPSPPSSAYSHMKPISVVKTTSR